MTAAAWAGIDIDEFPHLKKWDERMLARPGVERGRHVPSPHRVKEMSKEEMEKQAQEGAKCMFSSSFLRHLLDLKGGRSEFERWESCVLLVLRISLIGLNHLWRSSADCEISTGIQREQAKDAKKA